MIYMPPLLHAKIAAVCPIDGIWIGDQTNPATWGFWPSSVTPPSPAQLAAATALLKTITPAMLAAGEASIQAAHAAAAAPDPLAAAKAAALAKL